jgi:protocatechuate 4,5-dioxygenase beta chain
VATIVGAVTTSHVPLIGKAIARGLQKEPYWKAFFEGFEPVHAWLREVRPDVAVVIYNDHGLNFFLDAMPAFAIGAAREYANADEGWGLPVVRSFPGEPDLSWHLIQSLIDDEFDVTSCQRMLVDHAFTIPMSLLWPGGGAWPVRTVPVSINTVQHPLPSPTRCFKFGVAIGRALLHYGKDCRVVIVGTGGLSHQLDGARAGFINQAFDRLCMDQLVNDPESLTRYTNRDLIEKAGSQGVELLMWLAARGALQGSVAAIHQNYHVPISSTATGLLVMESRPS